MVGWEVGWSVRLVCWLVSVAALFCLLPGQLQCMVYWLLIVGQWRGCLGWLIMLGSLSFSVFLRKVYWSVMICVSCSVLLPAVETCI